MAHFKSILLFTPNMNNSTLYLSFKWAYNLNMSTYYMSFGRKNTKVMGEERQQKNYQSDWALSQFFWTKPTYRHIYCMSYTGMKICCNLSTDMQTCLL